MIVSASRRTDIPAFYTEWLMSRIRAGYCTVPNPFNRNQVACVPLRPQDVEVLVFWTRNPRPLLPHLAELDKRGYRYYFQYTVMNNPRTIDQKTPSLEASLDVFCELADRIGPEKVIWRYDPIVFSRTMGFQFHKNTFEQIAQALRGHTVRSVISIVDLYPKTRRRLRELEQQGVEILTSAGQPADHFNRLMRSLVHIAGENGMEIISCSEDIDLQTCGVCPGKCIDNEYIKKVFGINVTDKKDLAQREACGCVISKDIGMYDTCVYGCQYCYATTSFERSRINHEQHNPNSLSLRG